jgi:hypothetical protein
MWIAKCDRCGKLSDPIDRGTVNKSMLCDGWRQLMITGYTTTYPPKTLCPECTMYLGLTGEQPDEKSVGEHLIEILEEIAEGVQNE